MIGSTRARLWTIVAGGVFARVALAPLWARLPNGYTDEGFWKYWMAAIDAHGVLNIFRTTDTDYVGYHWILWLESLLYTGLGGSYERQGALLHLIVKGPPIAFDVALMLAVYAATWRVLGQAAISPARRDAGALVATAIVAFHPAIVYDSAVWAQSDGAITASMLAAIVLIDARRPAAGGAAWMLGFMVKPHPVMVLPVLAAMLVRQGWRAVAAASAAAAATALAILSPWLVHGEAGRILEVYRALFSADYSRLSASAWNAWWFIDVRSHPRPDAAIASWLPFVSYRLAGLLMSAAVALPCAVAVYRDPRLRTALLAASTLAFAFYVLPVSTHERYLLPFFGLLVPLIVLRPALAWFYASLSITFLLNLLVVAPPIERYSGRWVESPLSLAVAATNCALFVAFGAYLLLSGRMGDASHDATARPQLGATTDSLAVE